MSPTNQVAFDQLTRTVARELDAPWVCLSLLDGEGRLLASSYGMPTASALLISWSFDKEVIASGLPLVVADGARNAVTARAAAVRDGTVAAYCGMRIIDSRGMSVGTLSVMDRKPREWSAAQLDVLRMRSLSAGLVPMARSAPLALNIHHDPRGR